MKKYLLIAFVFCSCSKELSNEKKITPVKRCGVVVSKERFTFSVAYGIDSIVNVKGLSYNVGDQYCK